MARKPPTFDIFVGNLPQSANEKNLGKIFTPYGEIAGIIVKETTKAPPPNNKFAFVKFMCEPDAEKAMKELDKTNVQGTSITVRRADDRAQNKKRNFPSGDSVSGRHNAKDTEPMDSLRTMSGPMLAGPGMDWNSGGGGNRIPPLHTGPGGGGSIQEKDTIMITHVENPITVWIQVVNDENTQTIFHISEQLSKFCPTASPISKQPEMGKVYGCLFAEDNMWYRCQVKQTLGTDQFKIQYIDYGNSEEVSLQNLIEIPANIANVKGLACKVQLHNTRAKDITDKQAVQYLKSLTDNQMAQLIRARSMGDGSGCYGQIFVGDRNLSEVMINAGFCQQRPMMGKSNPLMKNSPQTDPLFNDVPKVTPLLGQSSGYAGGGGANMKRERNTLSPLNQAPVLPLSKGQHMPNMGFPAQFGMNHPPQDHGREKKLQNQLSKKSYEVEKLKNEKDQCSMQLEFMKSKIHDMQEEFNASAAKLQEGTLSKRINTVVSLAESVRGLREKFPTSGISCLLEDAMNLSMSDEHVDSSKCRTLNNVGSSLAKYKAGQDEISQCKEVSKLKELVSARDESRRELYSSVCNFLTEMESLPLEERSKQIQETQSKIVSVYGDYLKFQVHDVPSLENISNGFKTWKTKKDCEFKDVRTATDFCEEALQTALNQIQQIISVGSSRQCEKSEVDIDNLFKTYAHALQREINVTDMVHGKDASFVTTVIASIRKELHNEASTLENYRVLHQEFAERKTSMEPWLNQSPTFTDLQENRKLLRSLKSKLRHTLADKLDLEESGDEGELDNIKEEEEKIRSQLQATLVKADTLLHDVAALANENFPELIVQYPDLGIDSFLTYKGLVKANRDIDQYSLQPGFRPDVHISTFNGEQVLIQEFHVGDDDRCSKEDFMKQVIEYNNNTDLIQAVFFSKNERLAYVQTEWCGGELIESVMKSAEFTRQELTEICVRLTEKVVEVHKRGCVHGEITPQTVLLCSDQSVVLTLPDFSKKMTERLGKRYITESGLCFQCPEQQYSSPDLAGLVADVYNLVLLAFWLHFPGLQLTDLRSTNPEMKKVNSSMCHMFNAILNAKQSADQIKAEHVLQVLQEAAANPEPEPVIPEPAEVSSEPAPVSQEPAVIQEPVVSQEPAVIQELSSVPNLEPDMPRQSASPPVIKSTDEPMEIGVFRAEDYMTAPILAPTEPTQCIPVATDTDNSWTTESSISGSSASRGSSPLDNTVLENVSSSTQSTTQAAISSDTDTISEGVTDIKLTSGDSADSSVTPVADTADTLADIPATVTDTVPVTTPAETTVVDSVDDITGVSENTDVTVTNNGGELDISKVTEQGAACETGKLTLKMLLNNSKTFLTDVTTNEVKPYVALQNGVTNDRD